MRGGAGADRIKSAAVLGLDLGRDASIEGPGNQDGLDNSCQVSRDGTAKIKDS